MRKYFNISNLSFVALFSFLVFTISCKDAEVKKLLKSKKVSPDIEIFAYINNVLKKEGKTSIVIDVIDYNNNDNSVNQKKADRIDLPNGYSIINEKVELTPKAISDSVDITMQTLSYDDYGNFKFNEKVSLNNLIKIYNMPDMGRYKQTPFRITLSNDQITSITEIYIP